MSLLVDGCCRIIRGEAFVSPYSDSCALIGYGDGYGLDYGGSASKGMREMGESIGNASAFQLTPRFSRRNKIFRYGSHNAVGCSTKILEGYNFSITTSCLNMKNLERIMCGTHTNYPACPDDIEVAYRPKCGGLIDCGKRLKFAKPGVDLSSVTLTYSDGTPLVPKEDYRLDDFSICFARTIDLNSKDHIKIAYSFDKGYRCVQSFNNLTDECYSLDFIGCDAHHPEIAYHIHIPKLQFDPTDISLIGDDFLDITLTGQLIPRNKFDLKDSPESQYFTWYEVGTESTKGRRKGGTVSESI